MKMTKSYLEFKLDLENINGTSYITTSSLQKFSLSNFLGVLNNRDTVCLNASELFNFLHSCNRMNLRSVSIYTDTLIKNGKLKMYLFGFGENSMQYYNIFVDVVDTQIEDNSLIDESYIIENQIPILRSKITFLNP